MPMADHLVQREVRREQRNSRPLAQPFIHASRHRIVPSSSIFVRERRIVCSDSRD
jgi:hypothetical protein